jgi:hypothetical protein
MSTGDIFSVYDDLAVEVVSDTRSNEDVALSFSNRELAESICQAMEWEDFDLFETHDFEGVHKNNVPEACLAYGFLSFLRWRLFTRASAAGVGIESFNERAAAYSEYWYIRLIEAWNAHNPNAVPMKAWLQ